jgi:hypothetical protein
MRRASWGRAPPLNCGVRREMSFNFLNPLLSGLVGAAVVGLLMLAGRRPAKRKGEVRAMSYSIGFRLFAGLLIPGAAFVAYAAAQARPSQQPLAALIAGLFVIAALFFGYQAFLVSFAYDDHNVYYRSPLAGSKTIAWSDIDGVGYSGLLQTHYLRTRSGLRIWCSSMLRGFEELGAFLATRYGGPEEADE